MNYTEMYDLLVDYVGVDGEAIRLACAIGGENEDTMRRILFYYTGFNSFEGWLGEMEEEED